MIEYLNNCIEIDDTDDSLILELDDTSHARFGEIYGDVEDQQNLVDYIDTHGGKIDIIEVNGEPQPIGENKEVNVRVPVYVSDLENDSNFVSDANYVHTDNNYTNLEKAKLEAIDPESMGKVDDVIYKGQSVVENKIAYIPSNSYSSLERMGSYLYKVTFDELPEEKELNFNILGGCSSYVQNGKLYRNLDWDYSNIAEFIVKCKNFEGMSIIPGLNDGDLTDELMSQLPYHINDGRNDYGIMVSTHVLYNDFDFVGTGNTPITKLPYIILSTLQSMDTISSLQPYLNDIKVNQYLVDSDYLLQILVTDGITTYAIMPSNSGYEIVNITSNPKLSNFRWVNKAYINRTDSSIQDRPTGVERFNMMPAPLSDLKFTYAYISPDRLSEFIGINGTTKHSTDNDLLEIYEIARQKYLTRSRNNPETWQTLHSVVYSKNGIDSLNVQENYYVNYAIPSIETFATKDYVDNHHDTTKQDAISDLTTIRAGASKGNTAVQPADIADMASKTWVEGKGYITGIDSGDVVEALGFTPYNNTNPSGFQTASQVNTAITSKDYATNTRVNEVEAEIPEVVDNLTSSDSDKALSAKQGKVLNDEIDDIPIVSVSATGSSTTKAKYITVDGNEYNISSEDAAWGNITGTLSNQQDLNGALSTKADLVNGRIPIQQMPEFVVADVVEVETYEDLPAQGQSNTLYHVILTDTTYRWVGNHYLQISQQAQYYSLLIDTNISTMSQLKAAVDSVNNAGDHVFFDLHQLVNEGYVCTVHFWNETVSGTTKNYCEINDILNDRMYGVGQEWTTSQLVSNYCSAQNTLYDIKKLTINGTVATNNKGIATVTVAVPVSDVTFKNSTVVQNGIAIIPETLASFTADSTHRTVSDTEKTTWNNKLGTDALNGYATETYVNNHHDTTKQDTISDLATIRTNAGKGATAVQPADISDMATQTWVEGKDYATNTRVNQVEADIPTKTSDLTNDSGFVVESDITSAINTHNNSSSAHNDIRLSLASKQSALESGVNIKTLNGNSILGSGDLAISGLIYDESTDPATGLVNADRLNNHPDSYFQTAISDLNDIRSGATAGSTALQPDDNISELINDAGYLTLSTLPIWDGTIE